MKYIAILFFILNFSAFAQSSKTDSLRIALKNAKDLSEQLNIRLQLSNHETPESETYLENLNELLKLCRMFKNKTEELKTLKMIKNYHGYKGNFDKYLETSIEYANKVESYKMNDELVIAYHGIAQAFVQVNKFEQAQKYIDLGYKNIQTAKDSFNLYGFIEQEAFIAYFKGNFKKCLDLHFKALKVVQKHNSVVERADILNEIGLTYIQLNQFVDAINFLNQSMQLIQKQNSNVKNQKLAFIYSDLGLAYSKLSNHKMALSSFEKCLELVKRTKDVRTEMETYKYLADFYKSQKKYKQQNEYLIKFYAIKDSLYNNDNRLKMVDLENKYTLEKKNAEILAKEAKINEQKNQRNLFILLAFVALTGLCFLFFFNHRIKKKNEQIASQNQELEKLNQVKNRLFAILGHDLQTPLASLKMFFELSSNPSLSESKRNQYAQSTLREVSRTSSLIENLLAWANLQIKSNHLLKEEINLLDFSINITEQLRSQIESKNILIDFDFKKMTVNTNKNYLEIIIRNLLSNAIKYSFDGGRVIFSSKQKDHKTIISVADKGVGMGTTTIEAIRSGNVRSKPGTKAEIGSGSGLFLIISLLKELNATLNIESQENQGTTVSIQLDS